MPGVLCLKTKELLRYILFILFRTVVLNCSERRNLVLFVVKRFLPRSVLISMRTFKLAHLPLHDCFLSGWRPGAQPCIFLLVLFHFIFFIFTAHSIVLFSMLYFFYRFTAIVSASYLRAKL